MFCWLENCLDGRCQWITWRRRVRSSCLWQIGLILAAWQGGEWLARVLRLPIPGTVLGLAMLLALLGTGVCSVLMLRRGARWFLAQMLLFLLPAVMSLADHREFFGWLGCKLLAAVCVGTLIVMVTTALLVDGCYRWMLLRRRPAKAAQRPDGGRP